MQYDDASVADVLSNIETEETKDYSELYEAVNTLKEELKIPIVLYYAEDFNVREISQVLEITEGAVQKRLVRARQQLKRKLKSMEVTI